METEVKLTKLASCAGCGAKVGAGTLVHLLEGFRTHSDPRLLVGFDKSDDASVYYLDENTALVQTTDFFPPIVDDPFLYGQIAAALHHDVPGRLVQCGHLPVNARHHIAAYQSRLGGGGQHAHAQRLGQDQHVAGLCTAVGQDAAGMHEPGHRQAIDGLRSVDGVSSGDDNTRLIGLVVPAPQQLLHRVGGHGLGDAHDVQRQLRLHR